MIHDVEDVIELRCFCQLVLPVEERLRSASCVTILIHGVAVRSFGCVFDELHELAIFAIFSFNLFCEESYVIKDPHLPLRIVQYSWKSRTCIGQKVMLMVVLIRKVLL